MEQRADDREQIDSHSEEESEDFPKIRNQHIRNKLKQVKHQTNHWYNNVFEESEMLFKNLIKYINPIINFCMVFINSFFFFTI